MYDGSSVFCISVQVLIVVWGTFDSGVQAASQFFCDSLRV